MNTRQINRELAYAAGNGKNLYAVDVVNGIGLVIDQIRVVRAKTVDGVTMVRSVNGEWYRVSPSTKIDAR